MLDGLMSRWMISFLMRVLHCAANLDEQIQTRDGRPMKFWSQ